MFFLEQKTKFEIKRKIGRMLLASIIILAGQIMHKCLNIKEESIVFSLFFIVLIILIFDFVRVELNISPPFLHNNFIMRKQERKNLHGVSFASLSCLLVMGFSNFNVGLAAIAMATYGDSLAAIIGLKFGKTKFNNGKSLEGSLTMFAVSFLTGYIFLPNMIVVFFMATLATIIELITKHMPDDLFICIFTAAFGQIFYSALTGILPGSNPLYYPQGMYYASIITLIIIFSFIILYILNKLYKMVVEKTDRN